MQLINDFLNRILSRGSKPESIDTWVTSDFLSVPLKLTLSEIADQITPEALSPGYGMDRQLNAT